MTVVEMNRCRCEYYSKVTGNKETAIIGDRFDFINIIDNNDIDFDKEIRIFEKDGEWKLIRHIVEGKTVYKNYTDNKKQKVDKYAQALQGQKNLEDVISILNTDICPSREENQTMLEIIFDGLFCGEDLSKPKLKVTKLEVQDD